MSTPCTKTERETTSLPLTTENLNALSRKIVLEDWSAEEIDEKVEAFTSIMLTIMDETIPESVQTRSLRILDLDREYLPSISRRELATIREISGIQVEPSHPCHAILPDPKEYSYELRHDTFTVLSRTERHKQSFIARSCKYL